MVFNFENDQKYFLDEMHHWENFFSSEVHSIHEKFSSGENGYRGWIIFPSANWPEVKSKAS